MNWLRSIDVRFFWNGWILLFFALSSKAQMSTKIDEDAFDISIEGNKLFLLAQGSRIELANDKNWFFSEIEYAVAEIDLIETPPRPAVGDLPHPNGVKSIKLSNNDYLLLLAFYSAPSDSRVASGIDILLSFNSVTKDFWPASPDLMPSLGRGWGPCRNADMTFYLLQDVDQDGSIDIGVVREYIKCDFQNDIPSNPYFEQKPIKWYLNSQEYLSYPSNNWFPNRTYEGILPKSYAELTSLSLSPVDYVGKGLWKTINRLKWGNNMQKGTVIITKSAKKRAAKEAKKLKDKNALKMLKDYQYVRREPTLLRGRTNT